MHIAPYLAFLSRYPEIELDFHLTDSFVDIIRDGFDVATRSANCRTARSSPASPPIIALIRALSTASGGRSRWPTSSSTISAGAQEVWHLDGPDGSRCG